jgi:hypothetical protein
MRAPFTTTYTTATAAAIVPTPVTTVSKSTAPVIKVTAASICIILYEYLSLIAATSICSYLQNQKFLIAFNKTLQPQTAPNIDDAANIPDKTAWTTKSESSIQGINGSYTTKPDGQL